MNHAELLKSLAQHIQTASNTLSTAEATMQQIRQLDPGTISALVGVPIGTVQTMATAYGVFSKASSVYTDAAAVLQKASYDAQMLHTSPSSLLNMKAQVAYAYGGQYKANYDAEQAKLAALTDTAKQVQQSADSLGGINSAVAGVQTLAGQNLQIQAQLTSLNESISRANSLAYQEAMQRQQDAALGATAAATQQDAFNKARLDSLSQPEKPLLMPYQMTTH